MGVGPFERRYNGETKKYEWVKVPRNGGRKPEWNNENRKIAARIRSRQIDYENLINSPKMKGTNVAGFHRPGSAS